MYFILALIIGVSVVIVTIYNGKIAEKIGSVNVIVLNFSMGLAASTILFLLSDKTFLSITSMKQIPIFYFIGGLLGVLIIFLFNFTVPKIPAVYIVIIPFIGQIFSSAILDYFYLNIFSIGKFLGGIMFLLGLGINLWVDKMQIVKKVKEA